jgi:universal stress protein A
MGFRRMLIALDDSAAAAHAADIGADLARSLGAEVALVHAVDPTLAATPETGVPAATLLADADHDARLSLATHAARLALPTPPLAFIRVGRPAHEIIAAAREWQADLIVIASHGRRGVPRLLLGSVAEEVVRHAPCPVLVVRVPG